LMSGEDRVVYFLTGHGEYGLDDPGDQGFSLARQLLELKNYTVKPLNLLTAVGVPDDADAVVIARPIHPLEESEVSSIAEYLSNGGGLVVLQDSPLFTEFGDQTDFLADYLAQNWGIQLGQDLIVDQTSFLGTTSPVGVAASGHLITQKLQGVATAFPTAQSLTLIENENVSPVVLISTASEGSWAEMDLSAVSAGNDIDFDEGRDLPGPVPIAAVAENFSLNARLAVFGDGDFAMNANFDFFGNGDLFVNAVDWVVGQDDLISLTPRISTQRLMLPPQPYVMNLISLGVVCILPGIVLALGIGVWIRKRRRG